MIHNGGASGGHYYAYIKDFTTNQWLCFNDTTVTPVRFCFFLLLKKKILLLINY